ncbi:MAG: DUF5009 domain-containing protein [Saprospiraceae bacterium]|nr:DUF5009 domain-containing protein [Saprospiraceae bacterium]
MRTLPARLTALDAFRGLTIAGMILVNTPGSWSYVYPPLRHAEWEGCTPTDLVFPFFLFIVGVAMWYSFKKFDHRPSPEAWRKILKRAALIFLIGLGLNAFPFYDHSLSTLRIMGVLQRISVAFLFGAAICITVPRKRLHWVVATILLGYWALLRFLGGEGAYDLETNIARQVDLAVLGEAHVWRGFGIPFDPEGLMSSLPAVATVVLGFMLGSYIDRSKLQGAALPTICVFGVIGVALGLVWHQSFPIIKGLWTSSYVVYTAGIAAVLLAIFLWLIDVKGWKRWAQPFVVFGMNPLFIYALSVLFVKILTRIRWESDGETVNAFGWAYEAVFVPLAGNLNGSLLFALTYVFIHWLIAWWLFRRRIFIKV